MARGQERWPFGLTRGGGVAGLAGGTEGGSHPAPSAGGRRPCRPSGRLLPRGLSPGAASSAGAGVPGAVAPRRGEAAFARHPPLTAAASVCMSRPSRRALPGPRSNQTMASRPEDEEAGAAVQRGAEPFLPLVLLRPSHLALSDALWGSARLSPHALTLEPSPARDGPLDLPLSSASPSPTLTESDRTLPT